jgi:hypothetical protein
MVSEERERGRVVKCVEVLCDERLAQSALSYTFPHEVGIKKG